MRLVWIAAVCAMSVCNSSAQNMLSLMPMPSSVARSSGELIVDANFSVAITGHPDARVRSAAERFLQQVSQVSGIPMRSMQMRKPPPASLTIDVDGAGKDVQELGEDESYSLSVAPSSATLHAASPLGAIHGLQTFLQLVETTPSGFAVPTIEIHDAARFPWRGLMIDVSRHFIPVEVLKRNLDGMEAVKMNVFHWHLSDDQGFRIQSKKWPQLHEAGADGLFYTQEEVRDVIAYARDRGIRVVPEFDMPGHATAWFAGHPELASGPGPYEVERKWGILDAAIDPTNEQTYKFLDHMIGEMADLFPDQFFHIGGDEVNGKQWDANPKIQAFMRQHELKSNADLQSYFNRRVEAIVRKHGKTMEGWDEILRPELPKEIVIQSWRGQDSLASAARLGYRGILSAGYYLDLMYPAAKHYVVDPMSGAAGKLNAEEKLRILGGEACEWSEYASPENIDSRVWPRTAVIAERLWSPQAINAVNSMYERLDVVGHQLERLGLTHYSYYEPMLRRIAGPDSLATVRVLADVVEPVKEYAREELATTPATSATPLNRLVDAAHPESDVARQCDRMVADLIAGSADAETKAKLRNLLTTWRDNDAKLQPVIAQSFLLQEDATLSRNLSALGSAGAEALDYIEGAQPPPSDWLEQKTVVIQNAGKPSAQLLLAITGSIQRLVVAAAAVNQKSANVGGSR